jgi:enoyl-CoA hydratase/carnithine racemase
MRRMAGHSFDANLADAAGLAALMHTLDRLPKPTIALMQGPAYGGEVVANGGLAAAADDMLNAILQCAPGAQADAKHLVFLPQWGAR